MVISERDSIHFDISPVISTLTVLRGWGYVKFHPKMTNDIYGRINYVIKVFDRLAISGRKSRTNASVLNQEVI